MNFFFILSGKRSNSISIANAKTDSDPMNFYKDFLRYQQVTKYHAKLSLLCTTILDFVEFLPLNETFYQNVLAIYELL